MYSPLAPDPGEKLCPVIGVLPKCAPHSQLRLPASLQRYRRTRWPGFLDGTTVLARRSNLDPVDLLDSVGQVQRPWRACHGPKSEAFAETEL
jgi:hypothetical protein